MLILFNASTGISPYLSHRPGYIVHLEKCLPIVNLRYSNSCLTQETTGIYLFS